MCTSLRGLPVSAGLEESSSFFVFLAGRCGPPHAFVCLRLPQQQQQHQVVVCASPPSSFSSSVSVLWVAVRWQLAEAFFLFTSWIRRSFLSVFGSWRCAEGSLLIATVHHLRLLLSFLSSSLSPILREASLLHRGGAVQTLDWGFFCCCCSSKQELSRFSCLYTRGGGLLMATVAQAIEEQLSTSRGPYCLAINQPASTCLFSSSLPPSQRDAAVAAQQRGSCCSSSHGEREREFACDCGWARRLLFFTTAKSARAACTVVQWSQQWSTQRNTRAAQQPRSMAAAADTADWAELLLPINDRRTETCMSLLSLPL
ncbi:hypothetical protein Efla_003927 [Eimeria flavescens]